MIDVEILYGPIDSYLHTENYTKEVTSLEESIDKDCNNMLTLVDNGYMNKLFVDNIDNLTEEQLSSSLAKFSVANGLSEDYFTSEGAFRSAVHGAKATANAATSVAKGTVSVLRGTNKVLSKTVDGISSTAKAVGKVKDFVNKVAIAIKGFVSKILRTFRKWINLTVARVVKSSGDFNTIKQSLLDKKEETEASSRLLESLKGGVITSANAKATILFSKTLSPVLNGVLDNRKLTKMVKKYAWDTTGIEFNDIKSVKMVGAYNFLVFTDKKMVPMKVMDRYKKMDTVRSRADLDLNEDMLAFFASMDGKAMKKFLDAKFSEAEKVYKTRKEALKTTDSMKESNIHKKLIINEINASFKSAVFLLKAKKYADHLVSILVNDEEPITEEKEKE